MAPFTMGQLKGQARLHNLLLILALLFEDVPDIDLCKDPHDQMSLAEVKCEL